MQQVVAVQYTEAHGQDTGALSGLSHLTGSLLFGYAEACSSHIAADLNGPVDPLIVTTQS
jgi:hypothetical protein